MVDIIFSLNRKIWFSLLVAMNSIVQNATDAQSIRFNVLIPPGEKAFFEEQFHKAFPAPVFQWRFREYLPPESLRSYLDNRFKEKTADRRNSRYIQYSRFYLKDAFEDLSSIIYLDTDLIVLGDIAELYEYTHRLNEQCYFGAMPHFYPAVLYFSNPLRVLNEIFQFQNSFNAGVWFTNLTFWNDETYRKLNYYLDLDARYNYRLYTLGDEPVFNLMFKDYLQVDHNWNRCGYGSHPWVTKLLASGNSFLQKAKVIHWSGPFKPWDSRKIQYADLWRTYIPAPLQSHSPQSVDGQVSQYAGG